MRCRAPILERSSVRRAVGMNLVVGFVASMLKPTPSTMPPAASLFSRVSTIKTFIGQASTQAGMSSLSSRAAHISQRRVLLSFSMYTGCP